MTELHGERLLTSPWPRLSADAVAYVETNSRLCGRATHCLWLGQVTEPLWVCSLAWETGLSTPKPHGAIRGVRRSRKQRQCPVCYSSQKPNKQNRRVLFFQKTLTPGKDSVNSPPSLPSPLSKTRPACPIRGQSFL